MDFPDHPHLAIFWRGRRGVGDFGGPDLSAGNVPMDIRDVCAAWCCFNEVWVLAQNAARNCIIHGTGVRGS